MEVYLYGNEQRCQKIAPLIEVPPHIETPLIEVLLYALYIRSPINRDSANTQAFIQLTTLHSY